jgi:outer membrane usher protein
VPPGTYRVDIYLNNGFMTTRDVTFNARKPPRLVPCLTRGQLASMGVNTAAIAGMAPGGRCLRAVEMIKEPPPASMSANSACI